MVCYPFVLIEVKSGAEATLIENNMYLESDRNFFNGLCLIDIAQQGKLTHLVEQSKVSNLFAYLTVRLKLMPRVLMRHLYFRRVEE